ncbi:MAG: serine hydrolase, partial [Comamonadaceae bacterium]
ASDMLIDLVGIAEVNAVVEQLVPQAGFRRITSLGEVRRMIYSQLAPNTERLRGQDLLLLNRQRVDAERLQALSALMGVPVARFRLPSLDAAYNAYYATGVNSARLDAYGELLVQLVEGQALQPATTDHLVRLMERTATGTRRLKAGLPPGVRFAHKTGTQRRRVCDAGLLRFSDAGRARRVVVVACTRDEPALALSEAALAEVGAAICRSGLLTEGNVDAPSCHGIPPAGGLAPAAVRR